MRIISKSRTHFHGTHKGATIDIERERDGRFYITVTWKDGGHLYDGWAPDTVRTMREAKKEARRGACLDEPKPAATVSVRSGTAEQMLAEVREVELREFLADCKCPADQVEQVVAVYNAANVHQRRP